MICTEYFGDSRLKKIKREGTANTIIESSYKNHLNVVANYCFNYHDKIAIVSEKLPEPTSDAVPRTRPFGGGNPHDQR